MEKIRIHIILNDTSLAVVEAIRGIENAEIVQWDYSFDTAFQWLMFNENENIDVFFTCEYAQVSTVGESDKVIPRDLALLRRIRELRMMRPHAKFILLCDEDRDVPTNRHFLSSLVSMGVYDFLPRTKLDEEEIKSVILSPKNDITHVHQYLPENIPATSMPFPKKEIEVEKDKEKEHKAIDIFAVLSMFKKTEHPEGKESPENKERKRPRVKHIIEKVRPSAVSFYSVGANEAGAVSLATEFAVRLARKGAKTALIELHSSGIPRLGFHTGVISTIKTIETALQRIEDGEGILPVLSVPKEIELPHYDKAVQEKIKQLPGSLYILPGRSNITPSVHPFKSIKPSTLDSAPQEIVNQLIFGHNFDCVVFILTGSLTHRAVFHGIKASNYVYFVTDQHSAHISWLRQTLHAMERANLPLKDTRIVLFPYYELPNIRLSDIETALGTEVDYTIPDVSMEMADASWGARKQDSFGYEIARMVLETTGHKLSDYTEKKASKLSFWKKKAPKNELPKTEEQVTEEKDVVARG